MDQSGSGVKSRDDHERMSEYFMDFLYAMRKGAITYPG